MADVVNRFVPSGRNGPGCPVQRYFIIATVPARLTSQSGLQFSQGISC